MRRNYYSKDSRKSNSNSAHTSSNSLDHYFKKNEQQVKPKTFDTKWISPSNNGSQPCTLPANHKMIYPKNPQTRLYQLSIVRTCLFHNTLVCLPTGLGKTHIATFENTKIYFMAPTRPLVNQQKNSLAGFYEYIKSDDIIQLNGSLNSKARISYYKNKRIFFMTPQTLDNDLEQNRCEIKSTSLIIIDEAHRATGNYAYVNIIKNLQKASIGYRIIGLSATPGNTIEQVQQVLLNLKINRMQVKDQTDSDVKPYVFHKQIEALEIKSTQNITVAQKIMDGFMKKPAGIIVSKQAIDGYIVNLVKMRGLNQGTYFQMHQSFKTKQQQLKQRLDSQQIGLIYAALRILKYIVDGKKTLKQQGFESFKSFLSKLKDKKDQRGKQIPFLKQIIQSQDYKRLQNLFEDNSANHPKLKKLQDILSEYFSSKQSIQMNSKTIIFTHHRTSAMQIQRSLSEISIIKPYIFVGQSKTSQITTDTLTKQQSVSYIQMKQKQQIQVIRKFKQNQLNTLISTSIGQEGLDIGEVDLIICYDNGMSPIRMVQRMGRTGRKRNGRVILLLMQGKQISSYRSALQKSKNLKSVIKDNAIGKKTGKIKFQFYSFNPTMFSQNKQYQIQYIDNKKIIQVQQILDQSQNQSSQSSQKKVPTKKKKRVMNKPNLKKTKAKKQQQQQKQQQQKKQLDKQQFQKLANKYLKQDDCQSSQDDDTMVQYLIQLGL